MKRRRLLEVQVQTDWHKSESGCWSLSLGWRGCQVRVTQRQPSGVFSGITCVPGQGQSWKSFRTTSRPVAKERAEAFIRALFENDPSPVATPLTLGALWTMYQQESPAFRQNTKRTQKQKKSSVERLKAFFSESKRVEHLTQNDVARYALARRTGAGWPHGAARPPVRANAVRHDLVFLRSMLLWATQERGLDGAWLLAENPLRGMKIPREENPRRPVATYDRYLKVRRAMQEFSAQAPQKRGRERWVRMELALVLAEATGARIGAIRGLRWADIATSDAPQIRWRAEFDKRGRERVVPIPPALAEEVHRLRVRLKAVGEGWLFPRAETDAPWSREIFAQQLRVAEIHAEVPRLAGGLWHTYRRKWATERGDLPLKSLMVAGGWKDMQTLVTCYQHPSDAALLAVMAHPMKLRDRKTGAAG